VARPINVIRKHSAEIDDTPNLCLLALQVIAAHEAQVRHPLHAHSADKFLACWGDETGLLNTQPQRTPVAMSLGGTGHSLDGCHREPVRQDALHDLREGAGEWRFSMSDGSNASSPWFNARARKSQGSWTVWKTFGEERLNASLKQLIRSKVPTPTKAMLQDAAAELVAPLANHPARVRSHLQDLLVPYAA